MAKGWQEELDMAQALLVKATKKMKKWADAKKRPLEYKEGNLVMVKILSHQTQRRFTKVHKGLIQCYERPFLDEKRISKQAYFLIFPSHLELHSMFHVSLLKPYQANKDEPTRGESKRAPASITTMPTLWPWIVKVPRPIDHKIAKDWQDELDMA